MRLVLALAVLFLGCDNGEAVVVVDDSGRDVALDVIIEDTQPTCSPGQMLCSGSCVSIYTDPFHCGNCGVTCAATSICSSGLCVPTAASSLQ